MHACEGNESASEYVCDLIRAGANINLVNNYNESALMIACRAGDTQSVLILLEAGATVN